MTEDSDSDFEEDSIRQNPQPTVDMDGWVYKREDMQEGLYTPNLLCYEKVVNKIYTILLEFGEETLRKFSRCCFGKYTKLPKIGRSLSAMHYVIAREVIPSNGKEDPTELSFLINGKRLRFSRYEFALISGLSFGGSTFNMYETHTIGDETLYKRRFDKRRMFVAELYDLFSRKVIGDDPEDYVKVAKILFVCRVLIGCDTQKTYVYDWLWVLVEDSKEWDSFPWGSYSYQTLLHHLKKIKKKATSKERNVYALCGFTTAFLAWIYSAIPELAEKNGGISSASITPRVLWFNYLRSNAKVSEVTSEVNKTLEPSDKEKKSKYWLSVEPEGTPFELVYDHEREKHINYEEPRHQVRRDDAPPQQQRENDGDARMDNAEHTDQEQPGHRNIERGRSRRGRNNVGCGFTESEREALILGIGMNIYNHIRTDKRLIKEIAEKAAKSINKDHCLTIAIGREAAKRIKNELSDVIPGYMEYMYNKQNRSTGEFQQNRSSGGNGAFHQNTSGGSNGEFDQNMRSGSNGEFQNSQGTRVFQDTHNQTHTTPEDRRSQDESWNEAAEQLMEQLEFQTPHQPNNNAIPPKLDFTAVKQRVRVPAAALCSPFQHYEAWGNNYELFKAIRSKKKRNVENDIAVGKSYFLEIEDVTKELNNSQIEAYLCALYINPEFAKITEYDPRITITSTSLMPTIHRIWEKYHSVEEPSQLNPKTEEKISREHLYELSQYVTAEKLNWGDAKAWFDYDKVIVVVRTALNWVTLALNLKCSYVTVYDSRQHNLDEGDKEERTAFFIPLARILPQVLRYSGFYDARPELKPRFTQWDIFYPDEYLKNTSTTHSAVFALKYVDTILTGKFQPSFNQKSLIKYKKELTESIYNFSTDGDTIKQVHLY